MCRRNLIIISAALLSMACQQKRPIKHNYIFFYKPYTGELENNFFTRDSLKWTMRVQHANLIKADVEADFDRAIGRKDFRCIAISGYSYLFPGLNGYLINKKADSVFCFVLPQFEKLVEKDNFKVIAGTSDAINEAVPDVQGPASDYAKKYNRMMIDYVRGHHIKGK